MTKIKVEQIGFRILYILFNVNILDEKLTIVGFIKLQKMDFVILKNLSAMTELKKYYP